MDYRIPPFVRDSETSREAAVSMIEKAPSIRRKVWQFIHARGGHGATADEVQASMKIMGRTVTPRIIELRMRGRLKLSGGTRKTRSGRNAQVYISTALDEE